MTLVLEFPSTNQMSYFGYKCRIIYKLQTTFVKLKFTLISDSEVSLALESSRLNHLSVCTCLIWAV
jgi:hypothetical protein